MDDIIVYDSLMRSNIKPAEKSMIGSWFDKVTGGKLAKYDGRHNMSINADHAINLMQILRTTLESGSTSFALGAVHADMGLDLGKVPMDLTLGVASNVVSALLSGHEVSRDFLNLGTAGVDCFAFRKGYEWMAAKKAAKGSAPAVKMGTSKMAGESEDDPIVKVAKSL